MKTLLPFLLLLITGAAFAQRSYVLPEDYFISQFSDSNRINRIYCLNKNGEKVWLTNVSNFYVTLEFKDVSLKNIGVLSPKHKNGLIEGIEVSTGWKNKENPVSLHLSGISRITVNADYAVESPYFNYDSSIKVWDRKNDSLISYYSSGDQFVAYLIAKTKAKPDSILLVENACYNINFTDGTKTISGVIVKISPDSIVATTGFNSSAAAFNKMEYKTVKYRLADIASLELLKGGGFSYKKIT